ncbi:unnamed protein product [Effrenium voratum]|nr:unnamed protein product [Effrenium voratum]
MGVAGLLKALSDVQQQVHISEYRGLRVGVDAYCLLHRGKLGYADALLRASPSCRSLESLGAAAGGAAQEALLRPILDLVTALRAVGAEPTLVFDGGPLPAKDATERSRRQARDAAMWRAAVSANSAPSAKLLGGAVDITPDMAAKCVQRIRSTGVSCIVAPCEADAQLAFLALNARVDVCISEDVDLLAFGCQRVLYGLDLRSGCGQELRRAELRRSKGLAPYRLDPETLADLCVLGGCDYLPSLPRLGLRTAAQLLHRGKGSVSRALQLARREGITVPSEYGRRFAEARLVFSCQAVFNDETRELQPLRPLPVSADAHCRKLLGLNLSHSAALEISEARLNPFTLQPFATVEALCAVPDTKENGSEETSQSSLAMQAFRRPRSASDGVAPAEMPEVKAEGRDNDLCQPIHSARVAASDRPGKALGRVLDVDLLLADATSPPPPKRRRLGCRPGPRDGGA